MSKKFVSRLAAGLCGAALLCMTAVLPVFADPEASASESSAADADKPDISNPVSGLEYEETEDGGIRITKYKWTSAKNIEIPAEIDGKPVTELGEECFKYCYGETVKLPDSIRVIGERAFMFCDYVERIDVPAGCETIGTHAFDSCSRLKVITLPDTVTFIGFSAFEDSAFDETLTDEFCILGDHILYRYNGDAESVTVPDGVKYIAEYAFEGKENLKSVKLPDSVKVIYDMAFELCSNLSQIEVGNSIERISPNAVANTKWQMNSKEKFIILGPILLAYQGQDSDVTVPDGVRVIAKQAFNFNSSIVSVHLPDSEAGASWYDPDRPLSHIPDVLLSKWLKLFEFTAALADHFGMLLYLTCFASDHSRFYRNKPMNIFYLLIHCLHGSKSSKIGKSPSFLQE